MILEPICGPEIKNKLGNTICFDSKDAFGILSNYTGFSQSNKLVSVDLRGGGVDFLLVLSVNDTGIGEEKCSCLVKAYTNFLTYTVSVYYTQLR